AADAAGNSYAVGMATAPDGSTVFQEMKHDSRGQLIYRFTNPIVDGSAFTQGRGVAVDSQGRSYVGGSLLTTNGDEDVFLTRVTPQQGKMGYEFDLDTLTFGGSGDDRALALAPQLDPIRPTYAVVAGRTNSAKDFPITPDAYQPDYGGGDRDGFVVRTRL